jgi:hypothetical protein
MTDLAKLVVRLEAQSGKYLAELEKANAKLNSFGKNTESVLKKVAGGFAAYLGTKAIIGFSKSLVDSADNLYKMAQSTGVSVEALSQLKHAIELSGGDVESLSKGLLKLSKAAVEAGTNVDGTTAQAFRDLGIAVKDAEGNIRPTEELMMDLADVFERSEDGPTKAAAAMQLFGKSGAQLIPFLNAGSAGIRDLMEEADQLGLTISTKTAKEAEEFNDNMERLSKILVGVANQAMTLLLPVLSDLAESFVDTAKDSGELEKSAERLATFFKVIAIGGTALWSVLKSVGTAIGGIAAAIDASDLSLLDFANPARLAYKLATNIDGTTSAVKILGETFSDIGSEVSGDIEKVKRIWDGTNDTLQEVEITVKKLRDPIKLTDPKALKEQQKALDTARKTLADMNADLREQVATFGMGEAQILEYRLATGDLADEVAQLGASGKELAASILEQASALEALRNAEAIKNLDIQVMTLTGHTKEAALAAFDLQNAMLKTQLESSNDAAGLEKLAQLRQLTAAQAEYNDLQNEASRIQAELDRQEQRIQNAVLAGATTELQAAQQTSAARQNTVKELDAILLRMQAIADESGNPVMAEGVKDFTLELENLRTQSDLVGQTVTNVFKDGFTQTFKDAITGAKNFEDAVLGGLKNIGDALLDMILQNYAEQLFGSLMGAGSTGGGGGGWMSALIGAFGGSMDSGGHGKKGRAYMIGTGAQPEMFVPGESGQFIPRDEWMGSGMNVSQTFAIQAPQGTVSRQTQLQTGAEAGRGIQTAIRRNTR